MVMCCPNDGMSLGWHLFVSDVDGEGTFKTNGELIRCEFGKNEEELSNDSESGKSRTRSRK